VFFRFYADVYFHLARALDETRQSGPADEHWRAFLNLAPDNPWAGEARNRLSGAEKTLMSTVF
jgi:hypothetical protein